MDANVAAVLGNAGIAPQNGSTFRNSMPVEAYGYTGASAPALPPRPEFMNQGLNSYGMGSMGGYGVAPMGGYGMPYTSPVAGYGLGQIMGGYGLGSMGGYGMGTMGMNSYGGGYNRMGQNPYGYGDIESRFIQMAEENSRPAFESIQSLVYAVGGVSMMMENTFVALTSSFRAILGVAENFGRLRSLFAQFWTSFGILRRMNWLIRKLAVTMGIRTETEFKAWAEAIAATQAGTATPEQETRGSSWPVLLFFGVIAAAPYILLRMFNGAVPAENLYTPRTWKAPLKAVAQYRYDAVSPNELSFNTNQVLTIAPQTIQGQLWNSGWVIATIDGLNTGLIPTNYVRFIRGNTTSETAQYAGTKPPTDPYLQQRQCYQAPPRAQQNQPIQSQMTQPRNPQPIKPEEVQQRQSYLAPPSAQQNQPIQSQMAQPLNPQTVKPEEIQQQQSSLAPPSAQQTQPIQSQMAQPLNPQPVKPEEIQQQQCSLAPPSAQQTQPIQSQMAQPLNPQSVKPEEVKPNVCTSS